MTERLDPRGVRSAAAAVTTVVLAVVLLTGSGVLAALQAVVFAVPVLAGMRLLALRSAVPGLLAPRLGPPAEREDAAPVRFSQAVGLVFTVVAAVRYLSGAPALGNVATAFRPGRGVPQRRVRLLPRVRGVRPAGAGAHRRADDQPAGCRGVGSRSSRTPNRSR